MKASENYGRLDLSGMRVRRQPVMAQSWMNYVWLDSSGKRVRRQPVMVQSKVDYSV